MDFEKFNGNGLCLLKKWKKVDFAATRSMVSENLEEEENEEIRANC